MHRPDRHIKLARFKDYSARSEPSSGFGGKRTAYFAVGFVIDLQVTDWASVNHRTEKQPDAWEVFSTGFVFSADPANHVSLRCTFQGWWCNEEKERLLAELQVETDVKKRKAIIDRIQTVFYEDVGQVKLGDYFTLDVARRDLRGEFRTAPRMYFWNSWLAR